MYVDNFPWVEQHALTPSPHGGRSKACRSRGILPGGCGRSPTTRHHVVMSDPDGPRPEGMVLDRVGLASDKAPCLCPTVCPKSAGGAQDLSYPCPQPMVLPLNRQFRSYSNQGQRLPSLTNRFSGTVVARHTNVSKSDGSRGCQDRRRAERNITKVPRALCYGPGKLPPASTTGRKACNAHKAERWRGHAPKPIVFAGLLEAQEPWACIVPGAPI